MSKVFNLGNTSGKLPQFDITVKRLSRMLRPGIQLLDIPLVISSKHDSMEIEYQAPYFLEKVVDFKKKFLEVIKNNKKIVCFFVIANYFPPPKKNGQTTIESHGMVCIYKPNEVTLIFDPNGNNNFGENIYSSPAFNKIPIYDNIVNPLYRVVDQYIKNELNQQDTAIFSNGYIPCPTIPNSCMYRSIMFVFALKRTDNLGIATQLTFEYSIDKNTAAIVKTIINKLNYGDVDTARKMFEETF